MKFLPALLLNVVVVGAALAVYDQQRTGDREPPLEGVDRTVDVGPLEDRLAALEAERRPMLAADGIDPRVLERLDALDRRVLAIKPATAAPSAPDSRVEAHADTSVPLSVLGEEPTDDDVAQFRKLQAAARKQERAKRDRIRIDGVLAKLGIALGDEQREKLAAAYSAFEPRRNQIWTEAKTRGAQQGSNVDWVQIVAEAGQVIDEEFAARISEFLPEADSDIIAAGLNARGK